jgi:hypothetical protein
MLPTTARSDRSNISMLRLISESMPEARFSRVWRASSSSPRRMSSITLAQTAENPITVATEEAISNFADSRQRRLVSFPRPSAMVCSNPHACAGNRCGSLK